MRLLEIAMNDPVNGIECDICMREVEEKETTTVKLKHIELVICKRCYEGLKKYFAGGE